MKQIEKEWIKFQQRYEKAFGRLPTQTELAEVIGCSRNRLNRVIKGKEKPSQPMAQKIKIHTKISLDILLGE
tara:strand:+ start:1084 stop:1299 length:216 start_codon:yes stop_codon:yes gene_type:complete